MVKATIGKTTIEGTPEEVAYILNGLLTAQEEGTSVEVIHEAAPETEARIKAAKPRYKTLGEAAGLAKPRWKRRCGIRYHRYLGSSLDAWIKANFPNGSKTKKILIALRKAGIPYSVDTKKLRRSVNSARWYIKCQKQGYTKDEVEDLNEQA